MLLVLCNHIVSYHLIRIEIIQEIGNFSVFYTFFGSIVYVLLWDKYPELIAYGNFGNIFIMINMFPKC